MQPAAAHNFTPLSIPDPSQSGGFFNFFFDIIRGNRKFHVFLTGIVLGIIFSIQPAYQFYKAGGPYLRDLDKRTMAAVDEVFPDELEVKIKNGIASTNVQEPYHLTISQSTLEDLTDFKDRYNTSPLEQRPQAKLRLLTLNTKGKVEDFEQFQSGYMLTAKNLVYHGDGAVGLRSLSNAPDTVITKKIIKDKINEINAGNRILTLLNVLLYGSPVLLTLAYSISFFFEILVGALMGLLISKILKADITFKSLLPLVASLYAVPSLILIVIKWLPYVRLFYTWAYTFFDVVVLSLLYIIIFQYKKGASE